MIILFDFLKSWLYHLVIIKEIFFVPNKTKWIFEHLDSLAILIITIATVILILLTETTDPGVFYFIPDGKSYFDHKIGIPD